jgi:hypothetical protein
MPRSWKARVLILALILCCSLSACGIRAEKIRQTAKEKALEELGKLDSVC